MLCEKCGKNEANVQVQAFSMDGSHQTLNLCSECLARQKAEMSKGGAEFAEFMGSLFGRIAERVKHEEESRQGSCPVCGTTWGDVKTGGLMGCEKCYGAFRDKIDEILLKRNASARYVTARSDSAEGRRQRIRKLRGEMKMAIESENYEQAAFLRDEIHALEEQV